MGRDDEGRHMVGSVKQGTFLGALMGMAIGDALGMPVAGWPPERIRERYGRIDGYFPRVFPDGGEIKAGEFTEESELALCIVESFTVNDGELDPDSIGPRFVRLAAGEARRWIAPDALAAIEQAGATLTFTTPLTDDGPATGDVAARGIPIGLMHAVGRFDANALRADAETVTRITHGSPAAIAATTAVALLVAIAARGEVAPAEWVADADRLLPEGATSTAMRSIDGRTVSEAIAAVGTGTNAAAVVASAAAIAVQADDFASAVLAAVNAGGATDARAAIVGAIVGAHLGIAGIPQTLIDDLEGRIYVSLAVPWFYRAAMRHAGLLVDLRPEGD